MKKLSLMSGVVFSLLLITTGCQKKQQQAQLPEASKTATASTETARKGSTAHAEQEPKSRAKEGSSDEKVQGKQNATTNVSSLVLTGTTYPYRRSTLSSKVSGTIEKVWVRAGNAVKRGAPLMSLEAADFRLRLQQAEAVRDIAQAQFNAAEIERKRLTKLIADRAVSQSQFDRVDAQYASSKASLAQATVTVDMARRDLYRTTIRAPYDGIVTDAWVDVGEYVVTMPPTRMVTVEDIHTLELRIQVPETALGNIVEGTPIQVRFTAIDKTLESRVVRVVKSLDAKTRSFLAIAEIENRDALLRPGLFAQVRAIEPSKGTARR